jgi:transposase
MRAAWRTVEAIIERVVADGPAARDPFANLRHIEVDEISYTKGQRYLTVVIDHNSGQLVWATEPSTRCGERSGTMPDDRGCGHTRKR